MNDYHYYISAFILSINIQKYRRAWDVLHNSVDFRWGEVVSLPQILTMLCLPCESVSSNLINNDRGKVETLQKWGVHTQDGFRLEKASKETDENSDAATVITDSPSGLWWQAWWQESLDPQLCTSGVCPPPETAGRPTSPRQDERWQKFYAPSFKDGFRFHE